MVLHDQYQNVLAKQDSWLKITSDFMNSFCVYAKRKVWSELLEWKEQKLWVTLFLRSCDRAS
jgi:hypothetical protein